MAKLLGIVVAVLLLQGCYAGRHHSHYYYNDSPRYWIYNKPYYRHHGYTHPRPPRHHPHYWEQQPRHPKHDIHHHRPYRERHMGNMHKRPHEHHNRDMRQHNHRHNHHPNVERRDRRG